ncbi:hypothetical protein ACFL0T_09025, partial [Candidatus Omnitrophota bacterium]
MRFTSLLIIYVTLILNCCSFSEAADNNARIAQKGNALYKLKRFDKAIARYEEALSDVSNQKTAARINFNIGAALYM